MNKKKILLILSSMMIGLAGWFAFYTYAEFNGYPWKHAEVKREAAAYMKVKYNMDVAVAGSSYGFKFRDYTAKVFNIHDTEKRIIDVTMHAFYNKAAQGRGGRCWKITIVWSTGSNESMMSFASGIQGSMSKKTSSPSR
ncbi:hypothetical protein L5D93_25940 [Paenibacillus thiaminolyticus]|nr:hypothetical protein [Paenibacillus thiaminolyticus]